jgi:hypothetical protein
VTIILGGDSLNKNISRQGIGCQKSILSKNTNFYGRRDVRCDRMATPLGTNRLSFALCLSIAIMFVMLCLFV